MAEFVLVLTYLHTVPSNDYQPTVLILIAGEKMQRPDLCRNKFYDYNPLLRFGLIQWFVQLTCILCWRSMLL